VRKTERVRETESVRETKCVRETERERESERDREGQRERVWESESVRETERERVRVWGRQRESESVRETEREWECGKTEREWECGEDRERVWERVRVWGRQREWENGSERDSEWEREWVGLTPSCRGPPGDGIPTCDTSLENLGHYEFNDTPLDPTRPDGKWPVANPPQRVWPWSSDISLDLGLRADYNDALHDYIQPRFSSVFVNYQSYFLDLFALPKKHRAEVDPYLS
jgi:hypothetical protein